LEKHTGSIFGVDVVMLGSGQRKGRIGECTNDILIIRRKRSKAVRSL
jgi:hypothetical protein